MDTQQMMELLLATLDENTKTQHEDMLADGTKMTNPAKGPEN
jgi:hypothetical protein